MNTYLIVILSILIIHYLLDLVADYLNIRHIKEELPEEFYDYFDNAKYRQSQNYLRETTKFGITVSTVNALVLITLILIGGFNFVDHFARSLRSGPIITGLIFAGTLAFAGILLNLPFSIYDTFVIEEKYGFNKTTPKTFILDMIKSLLLTALIGGAIFAGILWFFDKTGAWAWLYCWIAVTVFQIFMMFISPYVIMPLFNKFVPLEEGDLRTTVEKYAQSQNFTIKGVYKMDGSKRSTKTNAFFTGFGKSRRIVLFDTLIEKHTTQELLSIIAHEMGHYKKKHIPQAIFRSVVISGLMFYLMSLFIGNLKLFAAFKMSHLSIYASLFFFGFLFKPVGTLIAIMENIMSRKHEYEADAYAAATTGTHEPMITGLKKLSVDNMSNLTPHPFKVFLDYTHPPVLQRIATLRKIGSEQRRAGT